MLVRHAARPVLVATLMGAILGATATLLLARSRSKDPLSEDLTLRQGFEHQLSISKKWRGTAFTEQRIQESKQFSDLIAGAYSPKFFVTDKGDRFLFDIEWAELWDDVPASEISIHIEQGLDLNGARLSIVASVTHQIDMGKVENIIYEAIEGLPRDVDGDAITAKFITRPAGAKYEAAISTAGAPKVLEITLPKLKGTSLPLLSKTPKVSKIPTPAFQR